jgi:hypothetical protein
MLMLWLCYSLVAPHNNIEPSLCYSLVAPHNNLEPSLCYSLVAPHNNLEPSSGDVFTTAEHVALNASS